MYRIWSFLFVFILSLAIAGCGGSKDLSRSSAKDLLDDMYPRERRGDVTIINFVRSQELNPANQWASLLLKEGLATEVHIPGANDSITVFLSEKGRSLTRGELFDVFSLQYIKVVTHQSFVDEITGIVFNGDKTSATVEYTESFAETPFAVIPASHTSKPRELPDPTIVHSVRFQLYDDGWRISDPKSLLGEPVGQATYVDPSAEQVLEGLSLSYSPKIAVVETFKDTGVVPTDRRSAGLAGDLTATQNEYTEGVDVVDGAIIIYYGYKASQVLQGKKLALQAVKGSDGTYSWLCGYQDEIPEGGTLVGDSLSTKNLTDVPVWLLPEECRSSGAAEEQ